MRILLLTDGISPFVIGGMQKHSYLLAKYLSKAKVNVELHHCVYNDDPLPNTSDAFSKEENEFISSYAYKFPPKGIIPGHYIRNSYKYSKTLFESCKNRLNEFDFIYTKGFAGWKLLEEKQKGLKMPKVGVKFHGMNMFLPTYGIKQRAEQYLLRSPTLKIMQCSDVVFSYGGKVTQTIISTGISRSKIIEIPTGIEEDWIRKEITPTGNIKKFIFIGRYDVVKGIRELNEALQKLEGNFEFHFVGPFEENQRIIKQNVFYHGLVADSEQIKAFLDKMDILVLPSYSEGMPNVILEAMARGLAILATDVGAVSSLVSNKNGLLLRTSNSSNILKGLELFLKLNLSDLDKVKLKSLEKVKKDFNWNILSYLFIKFFKKSLIA